MRYMYSALFVLLMLFGTCPYMGCSDNETSPKKESPHSTDLEHAWSQRFGDASTQLVYDIATDASGNVIIAGHFEGTVNFGGSMLASAGNVDLLLANFE